MSTIMKKTEAEVIRERIRALLCAPLECEGLEVMCYTVESNGLHELGRLARAVKNHSEPSMDITEYIGNMKVRDYDDMHAAMDALPDDISY